MADSDAAPLASLSLTHVYYNPHDPVSYLCAVLALVPQALCVVYVTLIWSTREAEVLLLFAGQVACEAVNWALKRLIKEQRPARIHLTGKGYGMPSSHAQFVVFWAVAVALFLLVRHRPRSPTPTAPPSRQNGHPHADGRPNGRVVPPVTPAAALLSRSFAVRLAISASALFLAAVVAWSRTYLEYHTPRQVVVGCAAGALSAGAWFVATGLVRSLGLLRWALDLPPARLLLLRDLAVEEDVCQAGWEKWEARRAELCGKKAS